MTSLQHLNIKLARARKRKQRGVRQASSGRGGGVTAVQQKLIVQAFVALSAEGPGQTTGKGRGVGDQSTARRTVGADRRPSAVVEPPMPPVDLVRSFDLVRSQQPRIHITPGGAAGPRPQPQSRQVTNTSSVRYRCVQVVSASSIAAPCRRPGKGGGGGVRAANSAN